MRKIFQASILAFVVSLSSYGLVFAVDISGAQPCGDTAGKAKEVASPFDARIDAVDNVSVYHWYFDGSFVSDTNVPNTEFNIAKLGKSVGVYNWRTYALLNDGSVTTDKTCYVRVTSVCDPDKAVCIKNPLSSNDFTDLFNNIINFIFLLSFPVSAFMVMFAGFLFMTGGGDPAKFKRAKDILLWTAIGFIVILISKSMPALIQNILGT